jgi:hypothetical protein
MTSRYPSHPTCSNGLPYSATSPGTRPPLLMASARPDEVSGTRSSRRTSSQKRPSKAWSDSILIQVGQASKALSDSLAGESTPFSNVATELLPFMSFLVVQTVSTLLSTDLTNMAYSMRTWRRLRYLD